MTGAFVDATAEGLPVDETDPVDFVVVGSGAGGGTAARVLSDAGHRVVVLEEGPMPAQGRLSPVMNESMRHLFRKQGKMVAFGAATIPLLQGCCVGGTTFVNSAIVWRLPGEVLRRWHRDFGLGDALPETALEEAFATIEEDLHVQPVTPAIASRQDALAAAGAERAGVAARAIRRNAHGCQGSGRCLYGCPHEAKQSHTVNYLRRAVAAGAHVVAHARVGRVLLDGQRAVGVAGRVAGNGAHAGRRFRVTARRGVVLAASAIQSPGLLRRSGLTSEHLGEHFMAHPGTSVMALYPERVDMWRGASQGYEMYGLRDTLGVKFETINVPPEVASARLPGAGTRLARYIERLDHLAVWAVALRAEAEGRVRPSWLLGDVVRYTLGEGDLARLRQAMKRLAEMHFLAGAVEVLPGLHGLPEVLTSPDQLSLFDEAPLDPRAYSLVATHLFGGCRAGRDSMRAVVDPSLAVHGCERLYVMDASVFPTNIGVNPQHSIMAIATVAARRLAGA
ncbi:MAG TPA: GMC family oxidoreductase [Polyangia bacterium]|nr:GMC family oxidoreductase [Polyangia bacterium]